jgi:hypothetical protein
MQRYRMERDHSIVVEACHLTKESLNDMLQWTEGTAIKSTDASTGESFVGLNIPTRFGYIRVEEGMYAVLYEGDFYPARKHQFETNYEVIS